MAEKRYLVIDLETTGLDANQEVPLEAALILVDEWGNEISHMDHVVAEPGPLYANRIAAAKQNQIVGPMHEASGLWLDLDAATKDVETLTRDEFDEAVVEWLMSHSVEPRTLPLMGSSIGSLDRPFVLRHFPKMNKFLSHRNVDISSFKEVCERLNPELAASIKELTGGKENSEHRALADARASIYEYQLYIENFFFVADEED